jgi:hypothetical protein
VTRALHLAAAIARDARVAWETRCLAALVYETLLPEDARLARNRRIHRLAARTDDEAFDDFVAFSKQECRLLCAREFFTADKVIARIEAHVRCDKGERDLERHGQFQAEAERAVAALPAMERAVVEHLAAEVHWVSAQTPAAINALVEQPRGTVVLTVKPPGSDCEIEIKRAGRARARPLAINRRPIAPSHRLDGGSMYRHLVFEAKNSAYLSKIYREIHGVEAPICRTVSIAKVPMLKSLNPAQAVQVGTTSFRLDFIARSLRGRAVQRRDVDSILDEILPRYDPPRAQAGYVDAAFRANRRRADATFIDLHKQIGTFWGTLLGLRGYSEGESFAVRNVGLRNVWDGKRWRVRVIFMDHDALSFAPVSARTIHKAWQDAKQVVGARGELVCLREIYRVGPAVERRGHAAFRAAMKEAYRKTRAAMRAGDEWDEAVRAYLRRRRVRQPHYAAAARQEWRLLKRIAFLF